MKAEIVTYSGAPIGPTQMPTQYPCKGYRVVPLLAAGATAAEVIAAYADLTVQTKRASTSKQMSGMDPTTVDDLPVRAPDWIRSPGFSQLIITSGLNGTQYLVYWAEDCYEVIDVGDPPYLAGFQGPGAGPSPSPGALVTYTNAQAQASTANVPAGAVGVLLTSQKGLACTISAPAAQTITGGDAVLWRFDSTTGRWCKTGYVESLPTGVRDVALSDKLLTVNGPGVRFFVELNNVTCSGAGAVTVNLFAQ